MKQLVLRQETKQFSLFQEPKQVVLVQEIKQLTLQGGDIVASILPFSVEATQNGQTVFILCNSSGQPIAFSSIVCLFIMGTGQNPILGDYTVSNSSGVSVVTLGATAPTIQIGDQLYGAGQV